MQNLRTALNAMLDMYPELPISARHAVTAAFWYGVKVALRDADLLDLACKDEINQIPVELNWIEMLTISNITNVEKVDAGVVVTDSGGQRLLFLNESCTPETVALLNLLSGGSDGTE